MSNLADIPEGHGVRVPDAVLGGGVLMVEHGWGGGVERHLQDLARFLAQDGVRTMRLRPLSSDLMEVESLSGPEPGRRLRFSLGEPQQAVAHLQGMGLGHAHIHSLVGLPPERITLLVDLLGGAGLPYDFTWHDYAPLCPRLSMVDWGGVYCDSPSTRYCQICVGKAGSRFGQVDVGAWRQTYRQVLNGARRRFAPDADVADRVARYWPDLPTTLRPHPSPAPAHAPLPEPAAGPVRTVALLGRMGPLKGSGVVLRLLGDALSRDLPLEFHLHGSLSRREALAFPNLSVFGEYDEPELPARLAAHPPDLVLLPSVCPETFSYTLDAALHLGLHPVCFDIGAPARRLRALGVGEVLPLQLAFDPAGLNDRLLAAEPRSPRNLSEPGRLWTTAEAYYNGPSLEAVRP